jgi:hypothetical protein
LKFPRCTDRVIVKGQFNEPAKQAERVLAPRFPNPSGKRLAGNEIVLAVMLLVRFPLFFIGLIMKNTYHVCGQCGLKLH